MSQDLRVLAAQQQQSSSSSAAAAAGARTSSGAPCSLSTANSAGSSSSSSSSQAGKSAFEWDVYRNRRTALQYLKCNRTLVDTIIETEDGRAHELVHSQVLSAFGDRLTSYMAEHGVPIIITNQSPSSTGPTVASASADRINNPGNNSTGPNHRPHHYPHPVATANRAGKNLKLVRLPLVTSYVLGILVECAYTGYIRTDLASGGIWQVLKVADFYQMEDVIRACCAFLIKNLSESNCIHFYHIGIKHRHQLQRAAWHQIRANFKHLLARELSAAASSSRSVLAPERQRESLEGSASSSAPAQELAGQTSEEEEGLPPPAPSSLATIKFEHFEPLLMHDKLNVDNEESIWAAIRLWCNNNPLARPAHLVSLLPCMRFPRFRAGTEFSSRHIWRDPLILNNKLAQHQLAVLDRNHRDFLSGSNRGGGGGGGGGGAGGGGGGYASLASASPFRDGFGLPCAVNPRQLRPRIPHSILLAIGGWQQGQPTTLIESYDVNCNLWFESRRRITSPLAYHGIEFVNSLLYICGGTDGSEILNEMFAFDPVQGVCLQKPNMREARCYVSTSCLGGFLYAMGGHNGVQRMRSVERFNLAEESWAHVHEMNVARSDASACVHGALIYIAGGLNDQVIESSVEFYNPADDSWTFISSMLMPRTSFTLLNFQQGLLAIGGNNGTDRLNSVEKYNFTTKLWSSHSQMRHRRSTFSAALIDDTKLFVVGGYNGQTPFSQVEMWDERGRAWVPMQKIRYDRSGLKVVVIRDLPNAQEYTFLGSQQALGQYGSATGGGGGGVD